MEIASFNTGFSRYFNKISHGTVVFGPGDFSVDDADYFRVHGHGIINAIT
ncbi:hypothetical protein AD06_1831 [Escherichia coli 7-233-03_S4_C2]|nr:hypothetical protein AD06_1831 [Escherichia coli 7-233-03_S4_C2]